MTEPTPASPRVAAALALVVAVGLAALAVHAPGVQFVDFIRFSERARELWSGQHLVDRLYPVGYPALLALVAPVVGNAVTAGKAISVIAGSGLAFVVARRFGIGAGAWVLVSHAALLAGSTEGTDMTALALALGALVVAERPVLAAVFIAGAVLTRYTALVAVPVVIALSPRRRLTLGLLLALTAPHWLTALVTHQSMIPDQSENIAIAAGAPVPLFSIETLRRWPGGFGLALEAGLHEPVTWVGLLGYGFALVRGRKSRRAAAPFVVYGVLHAAALGLAFSNERLALPITVCAALGVAWLVPGPWIAGLAAVVAIVNGRLPGENVVEAGRARAVAILMTGEAAGPVICTSPWFYRWEGPWVVGGIGLSGLGGGREVTPESLKAEMASTGADLVALEVLRTRRQMPALEPLMSGNPPKGWTLVGKPQGWRVWRADPQ